jgi:hypothetical protein
MPTSSPRSMGKRPLKDAKEEENDEEDEAIAKFMRDNGGMEYVIINLFIDEVRFWDNDRFREKLAIRKKLSFDFRY